MGILRAPDGPASADMPGVIFMNAGIEHRVGPRRLYVGIARSFAQAGYPSLCFDYSGLGESRKSSALSSVGHSQATLAEGLAAAELLIDGYVYPNSKFYLQYYLQRLFSPQRWGNFVQRKLSALKFHWRKSKGEPEPLAAEEIYFFDMPSREQLAGDLHHLVARQAKLLYIYSGDAREYYNYGHQFRDNFPKIDLDD